MNETGSGQEMKAKIDPKQALSVEEVANLLGVERKTVAYWVNSGKLPAQKYPGRGSRSIVRVSQEAVKQFQRTYDARNI